MAAPYDFASIETRWQAEWSRLRLFETDGGGEPYYCLMMFPYPSGKLHMGHIINYSIGDSMIRHALMRGKKVLAPMGWDSFGLPAENHAIRTGTPPAASTRRSIAQMREQMRRAGLALDWSREIATHHPGYYRWTQWLFLEFFKKGLAFRKKAPVNWCGSCQTVLANEQVQEGICERCGTTVEQRDLEQWFFRMSAYAQKLLDGHERLAGKWPDKVLKMQREWIGRSEGARLDFALVAPGSSVDGTKLPVFTTRPDTVYGVTFLSLAPEHPMIEELVRGTACEREVKQACLRMRNQDAIARTSIDSEKEGIWTGRHVRNPFDGALVPLWIANYALMDYGSGAVMAVPAHDQRDFLFARKYGLPIRIVIQPDGEPISAETLAAAHEGEGTQVASGPFDGIHGRARAVHDMTAWAKEKGIGDFMVNYRLKDWLLSRQRYWGAPIPVVYCPRCGIVGVPENELPILLPENVEFRPTGESPLARAPGFVAAKCPTCGGPARRETDTMDTFVDSSWYYLRYTGPRLESAAFDRAEVAAWLPVHQYVGGSEHSNMHLIYARFFTKVLHEMGLVPFDEPFERLFCQGMVCNTAYRCEEHKWLGVDELDESRSHCKHCGRPAAAELAKMSKTKKNGVSPDELFTRYGADTVHAAILFLGPPAKDIEYEERGVQGVHRFIRRLWESVDERLEAVQGVEPFRGGESVPEPWRSLRRKCHEILARITAAFDSHEFGFNTCIAGGMEVVNAIREAGMPEGDLASRVTREVLELTVQMLAPFAPHVAEEMWSRLGLEDPSIFRVPWPSVDPGALQVEEVEVAVQVNGKVRGRFVLPKGSSREEAVLAASKIEAVQASIQGLAIRKAVWVQDKLVSLVAG